MRTVRCDVLVVGSGPAGSTAAALIKRHQPGARVILLERLPFPRHRIGESLLPASLPVLREMGADRAVDAAGFVRKVGITFVWGCDGRPWDADFAAADRTGAFPPETEFVWHVERARYDAILVESARRLGVEVWKESRAAECLRRGGRVVGAIVERGGSAVRVESRILIDASGLTGFVDEARAARRWRKDLKNVAAYGYYRGARWPRRYPGHPDKTRTFICARPEGWFWYIPLAQDLVSVGLVARAAGAGARGGGTMREFFEASVRRAGELKPLLRGARLVPGMDPADPSRDFFTACDWSYEAGKAAGPGWFACGDAAFFIDPLLSSGVLMAHLTGHRAAYAACETGRRPSAEAAVRRDYEEFCGDVGAGFLSLVGHWYARGSDAGSWRRRARAVADAAGMGQTGRSTFAAVGAGFDRLLDRLHRDEAAGVLSNQRGLVWRHCRMSQELTVSDLDRADGSPRPPSRGVLARESPLPGSAVLRWRAKPLLEKALAPVEGEGRFLSVTRLSFPGTPRPRRLLPRALAVAASLVDGRRTLGEIKRLVSHRFPLPPRALDAEIGDWAWDLAEIGVLDARARRAERPAVGRGPWKGLRLAEAALARDEDREALRLLDRALASAGPAAWPLALRGELQRRLGRSSASRASFSRAVSLLGGGRGARGVSEFDAGVEAGWSRGAVLSLRGVDRLVRGDAAGAGADAREVLRLDPMDPDALALSHSCV